MLVVDFGINRERRGGRRRRYILPSEAPVFVSSGRWGRRRARVNQCWATLRAEAVYDQFLRERVAALKPGWRATVRVQIRIADSNAVSPWSLDVEVLPNPIWRRGRLFYRCPACARRASRLYVPLSELQPRCRRCWGLNYASQGWTYNRGWPLDRVFRRATTQEARAERRRAARLRYAERRALLFGAP